MSLETRLRAHLQYLNALSKLRTRVISAAARHDDGLEALQGEFLSLHSMRKKPVYKPLFGGPYEEAAAKLVASPVFYVAAHQHEKHGLLFVAAFGRHSEPKMAPVRYDWLSVSKMSEGPEIFTIYRPCGECRTLETGAPVNSCAVCRGVGWERTNGKPTGPFGTPVEILAVLAPTAPEHAAHYNALVGGQARSRT